MPQRTTEEQAIHAATIDAIRTMLDRESILTYGQDIPTQPRTVDEFDAVSLEELHNLYGFFIANNSPYSQAPNDYALSRRQFSRRLREALPHLQMEPAEVNENLRDWRVNNKDAVPHFRGLFSQTNPTRVNIRAPRGQNRRNLENWVTHELMNDWVRRNGPTDGGIFDVDAFMLQHQRWVQEEAVKVRPPWVVRAIGRALFLIHHGQSLDFQSWQMLLNKVPHNMRANIPMHPQLRADWSEAQAEA